MKPQTRLSTAAIGFHRNDGDFQLLATLNNNDELISPDQFTGIVHFLRHHLQDALSAQGEHTLTVLERQDAPDYVTLDDDEEEWTDSCKESCKCNMTPTHNCVPSRTTSDRRPA